LGSPAPRAPEGPQIDGEITSRPPGSGTGSPRRRGQRVPRRHRRGRR
jgi:hypothetical protein